jgi:protease-4
MSKKGCLVTAVIVIIIIIILIACAGVCILFGSVFSEYDLSSIGEAEKETLVQGGDDKIVVIDIEGLIMDTDSESDLWGSSYASSGKISKYIDSAIDDPDIKAIILSMDTPGGDVYASDIIYNKVKEAQASGIFVVTLMKGTAASGGYYIASTSDEIIASPLTITGSIGVLMQAQSYDGLYEKLGIETVTITNSEGDYKTGAGLFDDDPTGEEDQIYQEIVDETFEKFLSVIIEGRNLDRQEVLEIADGRVFTGQQALELGLVDELGAFDEAVTAAEELAGITGATVIKYEDYDFWSSLAGYVSNVVNPTATVVKNLDLQPGPKLKYLYEE